MNCTVYEDYKYSMQDTGRVYVGCKYTFRELLAADEVLFKFRMLVQKYILPEADPEDTLETHLYYLSPNSFLVKLYNQMKARIKVNVIEEKKNLSLRFRGSENQRLIDVPASLKSGQVVLWEDWQGDGRGMK